MPTLSSSDPVLETYAFWDRYSKQILAAIVFALLALAAFGGYRIYSERRLDKAAHALSSAKTPADFQKVTSEYSGTPAAGSAFLFLADAQKKEGKFAEANTTLQKFLDKYPKHELAGTARLAMAGNLETLGKKDEALATYQRLVTSDPKAFTAPVALLSQIHLLKEKNQLEEARRVCETILTQYRDSASATEATRQLRLLKPRNEAPTTAVQPTTVAPPVNKAPVVPGPSAAAPLAAPPSVAPMKKP